MVLVSLFSSLVTGFLHSSSGADFIAEIKPLGIFLTRDFLCEIFFFPYKCYVRLDRIFTVHLYRVINFPVLFSLVAELACATCSQWDFLLK